MSRSYRKTRVEWDDYNAYDYSIETAKKMARIHKQKQRKNRIATKTYIPVNEEIENGR